MRNMKKVLLVGIVGIQILAVGTAWASGYGLREHSAKAMGAAYAGASASGSDASFLFYNPASLSMVENSDFSLSGVGILPTSSASYSNAITSAGNATGGDATPSDFIENALIPSFAARVRLSPRLAWGVAVGVPWGLSTSYEPSWTGRYYGLTSKLQTANIMSALSYEVTPMFSIAAGVQAQYGKGRLSSAVDLGTIGAGFLVPGSIPGAQDGRANYTGDDWGFGFTLGAIAQLSENTTVGASFLSEIRHTFEGPLTFELDSGGIGATINFAAGLFANTNATANLTTPAKASFNEFRVNAVNPAQPPDITTANWEDSWMAALGFEFMASQDWTLRFGAAYDASPAPDSFREPRVPDNDRIWLSSGATYEGW
ncbi:MAG: OmpP1/FadL family transporter, partial [Alphaproteobacteria bacterium]